MACAASFRRNLQGDFPFASRKVTAVTGEKISYIGMLSFVIMTFFSVVDLLSAESHTNQDMQGLSNITLNVFCLFSAQIIIPAKFPFCSELFSVKDNNAGNSKCLLKLFLKVILTKVSYTY